VGKADRAHDLLVSHPRDFTRRSACRLPGGLVTVRYINGATGHGVCCYCATIELPTQDSRAYVILPGGRGHRRDRPFSRELVWAGCGGELRQGLRRLGRRSVPGWEQIVAGSRIAHGLVPATRAVAWDWAITPEGPLVLEGNAGWAQRFPKCCGERCLGTPPRSQGPDERCGRIHRSVASR